MIAYLGDCLFRAEYPLDAETSRELAFTKVYFPELQQAIERVERIYSEQPDLRRTFLLAAVVEILNRLL